MTKLGGYLVNCHLFFMSLISTTGALQSEIGRKLNELSISSGIADRYLDWINEGIDDIVTRIPNAEWLETSAVLDLGAGAATYQTSGIGTDFLKALDVRISAKDIKLSYLAKETFDKVDPGSNQTGTPNIYTLYNDTIQFHPSPTVDDGVQISYLKDSVTVSAASAVPEIPRRFLKSLAFYGWAQGLYLREDFNEAQLAESKYEREIEKIKRDLMKKSMEAKKMISVRDVNQLNIFASDNVTRAFFN